MIKIRYLRNLECENYKDGLRSLALIKINTAQKLIIGRMWAEKNIKGCFDSLLNQQKINSLSIQIESFVNLFPKIYVDSNYNEYFQCGSIPLKSCTEHPEARFLAMTVFPGLNDIIPLVKLGVEHDPK